MLTPSCGTYMRCFLFVLSGTCPSPARAPGQIKSNDIAPTFHQPQPRQTWWFWVRFGKHHHQQQQQPVSHNGQAAINNGMILKQQQQKKARTVNLRTRL